MLGDVSGRFSAGDTVLIPPATPHCWYFDSSKTDAEGNIENVSIFFEAGETGAHQLYNHTDEPCVFLDIRNYIGHDVCEYPDSNDYLTYIYRKSL